MLTKYMTYILFFTFNTYRMRQQSNAQMGKKNFCLHNDAGIVNFRDIT
jgi:hypothetical protein